MRNRSSWAALALGLFAAVAAAAAQPHNIVLFVADGLRAQSVTPGGAPTLSALARRGVSFVNSHSVYPTLTTVNAAAIATGHLPGDTGEYGNSLFFGFVSRCPTATGVAGPIANVENDCVLADLNAHYGGENYLNETSVLAAAQARGWATAVVGKLGPAALQNLGSFGERGRGAIVIDDQTFRPGPGGVPISDALRTRIDAIEPPGPQATDAGARRPQSWFTEVATHVLLPRFKAAGRPFLLVYWCRDPDATQHGQADSPGRLNPGVNGPSSRAAIRTADQALAGLLEALRAQGLEASTDVIVTADHGFATVAKESRTSLGVRRGYAGVARGELAPGFVAIDLASALGLPLYPPSAMADPKAAQPIDLVRTPPKSGDALLGPDPSAPEVIVAANSGTDLIYLPSRNARRLAPKIVAALQSQDYTGAVFVRDDLARLPGTLRFSDIGLAGSGRLPSPAIVVSMRTFAVPGCTAGERLCAAVIPDAAYRTGQGTHGSLSRAETNNFMAVAGPSFKSGYVDPAPVGNADVAITMARLIGLDLPAKGRLTGRVMSEALKGGAETPFSARVIRSTPGPGGLVMTLDVQTAGGRTYLDAAGYPGRVVGLAPQASTATPMGQVTPVPAIPQ